MARIDQSRSPWCKVLNENSHRQTSERALSKTYNAVVVSSWVGEGRLISHSRRSQEFRDSDSNITPRLAFTVYVMTSVLHEMAAWYFRSREVLTT